MNKNLLLRAANRKGPQKKWDAMNGFAQEFYDYHRTLPCNIVDFTDCDEVQEGVHLATEKISGCHIACSDINHTNIYYIDSNGEEWLIKEMEIGAPIMVLRK